MGIIRSAYKSFRCSLRDRYIGSVMRDKLLNNSFTVISSDCTGGMLYHDLKLRFDSPTINMFFMASDYIKFCNNIKHYIDLPMIEIKQDKYRYPVVSLGDIKLHLVHYKSVAEAQEKWNTRKERINWENMFFVMNDRNECHYEDIVAFDNLNVENKVIFTHVDYPEINSSFYIRGFEKRDYVDTMTRFVNPVSIKRNMDQFDFPKWLNEGFTK